MGIVEIVILIVVVAAIVIALLGWDRYRGGRSSGASAAAPTDEVFIDPVTGGLMRVWDNPDTGQREYRPEGVATAGEPFARMGTAADKAEMPVARRNPDDA